MKKGKVSSLTLSTILTALVQLDVDELKQVSREANQRIENTKTLEEAQYAIDLLSIIREALNHEDYDIFVETGFDGYIIRYGLCSASYSRNAEIVSINTAGGAHKVKYYTSDWSYAGGALYLDPLQPVIPEELLRFIELVRSFSTENVLDYVKNTQTKLSRYHAL